MPILLHGDAAFAGQGIVAETLNLYALEGYSTGGTLHLITNNQVGFTTDPAQGRSTRHSSDLAKGFDTPIIHVNADDPEAAISAVRLALAYRGRFGHDVVIDLVGYRRFGHNEQDEPAYTQPLMAEPDREPPDRARALRRAARRAGRARPQEEAERARRRGRRPPARGARAAEGVVRPGRSRPKSHDEAVPREAPRRSIDTTVREKRLRRLTEQLLRVPEGFTVNPKLARQLERRARRARRGRRSTGGTPRRSRSRRSLARGSRSASPARTPSAARSRTATSCSTTRAPARSRSRCRSSTTRTASFEVYNSPLSEYACVGFEYGYSTAAPEALVLWEAQFGDFANGAQTIIDQFISSGLAKWKQTSRLTLLLPHGYEGNGPEHSSARLERFLQLAAQENMRIANCTTAAQYFHLLRRQALDPSRAAARRDDAEGPAAPEGRLVDARRARRRGRSRPMLDADGRRQVGRSAGSSSAPARSTTTSSATRPPASANEVAVARLEQLYPFPVEAARELIASYPALDEIVWAQEEPQNMGAWRTIRHRLEEAAARCPRPLRRAARGARAPPRATRRRTRSSRSASRSPP